SLIFTHGAGGGMTNPATTEFAHGYASISSVVLFQAMGNLGHRTACFETVLEHSTTVRALGGRSMGARAAVLTAKSHREKISALVLVSFPLMSAKAEESREDILLDIDQDTDVLFISGERDSMCDLEHLGRVRRQMKAKSWLLVVEGADHGMSLSDKESVGIVRRNTGQIAAAWVNSRDEQRTELRIRWDREKAEVVAEEWQ
ncbi:hypothetical protein K461DRAFT_208259, partial [Myriangium duriaei CBS 260.36]